METGVEQLPMHCFLYKADAMAFTSLSYILLKCNQSWAIIEMTDFLTGVKFCEKFWS